MLAARLAVGVGELPAESFIFTNDTFGPIHPDTFGRKFRETVAEVGLPAIRVHDLRHTWATLALAANVHPKVVQERLGHTDVGITLNIYSHVTGTMDAEAAATVVAVIGFARSPGGS